MNMTIDRKRLSESDRVWLDAAGQPINIDRAWQKSDQRIALTRRQQALLAAAGMDGPEARWYVLRVESGQDKAVDKALDDANVEHWMPVMEVSARWRSRRKVGLRRSEIVPVLPGYVLVKVISCPAAWAGIRCVKGVVSVLGGAHAPCSISDDKVLKLRAYVEKDPAAIEVLTNALKVGDQVMVTDGPFASFPGIVEEVMEKGRALVEVVIFGRATPVDLDLAQISKSE